MQKNVKMLAMILVLLQHCSLVWAVVYGSNTVPTYQFYQQYFPAAENDNTVLGFAAMFAGFFVEDQTTSCTFDAFFPSGNIGLNGGKLYLSQDLPLANNCEVVTSGTIIGNFHEVSFKAQTDPIAFPYWQQLVQLDSAFSNTINSVSWSPDDLYVLSGTSTYAGQTLRIYSWDTVSHALTLTALRYAASDINQLAFHPTATSPYYFAAAQANGLRILSYTASGVIAPTSSQEIGNICRAVSWAPSGTYLAVSKTVAAEEIAVYSVSAGVATKVTGYDLSGSLTPALGGLAWDSTGRYLAVTTNDQNIYLFVYNGAALYLVQTIPSINLGGPLSWSHNGNLLAAGSGYGSLSAYRLQLYSFNGSTLTIQYWPGTTETGGNHRQPASWDPSDTMLAVPHVRVTWENALHVYDLNYAQHRAIEVNSQTDSNFEIYASQINNLANINDLSTVYIATGGQHGYTVVWGYEPDTPFTFTDASVVFDSPVNLTQTLYFGGNSSISANGNKISLHGHDIVLLPGATLSITDAVLDGVGQGALQFLDNTATLSLANVTMMTNGNVTVQGQWDIIGDVVITGTNKLTYATSRLSTIYAHATLLLDSGMTFSYYPSGSATNLLAMQDSTAQLYLKQVESYIQPSGLTLTYGTLTIDGECPLYGGGSLSLSDGNPSHAVTLNVLPESGIRVMSGSLYD